MNKIVLCQVDYTWLKTSASEDTIKRDFRALRPRMQISLEEGFITTSTKDGVRETDSLEELKEDINKLIKKYYSYTDHIINNETELKNKLERTLKDQFEHVQRETTVLNYGLRSDFSLLRKGNEEIWEVKVGQAGAPEFIQLVGYLLTTGKKHGVLMGRSFNDNAKNLAQDSLKLFGVNIDLKELEIYNL